MNNFTAEWPSPFWINQSFAAKSSSSDWLYFSPVFFDHNFLILQHLSIINHLFILVLFLPHEICLNIISCPQLLGQLSLPTRYFDTLLSFSSMSNNSEEMSSLQQRTHLHPCYYSFFAICITFCWRGHCIELYGRHIVYNRCPLNSSKIWKSYIALSSRVVYVVFNTW